MAVPPEELNILARVPHRPLVPGDAREVQTLLHQIAAEQTIVARQLGDVQATQRDQGKQIDSIVAAGKERDQKLADIRTELAEMRSDRKVFVLGVRVLWSVIVFTLGGVAWLFGGPAAEWARKHLGV